MRRSCRCTRLPDGPEQREERDEEDRGHRRRGEGPAPGGPRASSRRSRRHGDVSARARIAPCPEADAVQQRLHLGPPRSRSAGRRLQLPGQRAVQVDLQDVRELGVDRRDRPRDRVLDDGPGLRRRDRQRLGRARDRRRARAASGTGPPPRARSSICSGRGEILDHRPGRLGVLAVGVDRELLRRPAPPWAGRPGRPASAPRDSGPRPASAELSCISGYAYGQLRMNAASPFWKAKRASSSCQVSALCGTMRVLVDLVPHGRERLDGRRRVHRHPPAVEDAPAERAEVLDEDRHQALVAGALPDEPVRQPLHRPSARRVALQLVEGGRRAAHEVGAPVEHPHVHEPGHRVEAALPPIGRDGRGEERSRVAGRNRSRSRIHPAAANSGVQTTSSWRMSGSLAWALSHWT